MRNKWRSITLAVLLVVISGAIGAWLGNRILPSSNSSHQAFHEELFKDIHLSSPQRETMHALERRHSEEKKRAQARVNKANADLAILLKRQNEYTDQTSAAIDHVHAELLALQKLTIMHLYEMRRILDPDQRKIFDRHVEAAFHEFTE
ncbi:MAG: periplasmic heavy metal sensor [Oricola sp.]|nr:periplasmic heavy metal sensor [Oricola sp.]